MPGPAGSCLYEAVKGMLECGALFQGLLTLSTAEVQELEILAFKSSGRNITQDKGSQFSTSPGS